MVNNNSQCVTCNHKDHDAGRCSKCNCGESERIHYGESMGWGGYNADLSESVNHIYNASGELRGERNYHCERKRK